MCVQESICKNKILEEKKIEANTNQINNFFLNLSLIVLDLEIEEKEKRKWDLLTRNGAQIANGGASIK